MVYEPKKMAGKSHKSEEIGTKRRQVDVLNAQGKSIVEANWHDGVTHYRWRSR